MMVDGRCSRLGQHQFDMCGDFFGGEINPISGRCVEVGAPGTLVYDERCLAMGLGKHGE